MQAAFAAMLQAMPVSGPYAPRDITADTSEVGLSRNFGAHIADFGLTAVEMADITDRSEGFPFAPYLPGCAWKGQPVAFRLADGPAIMTLSFSRPLFSGDSRLAVVAVTTSWGGRRNDGRMCVVRWSPGGWQAKCRLAWIS